MKMQKEVRYRLIFKETPDYMDVEEYSEEDLKVFLCQTIGRELGERLLKEKSVRLNERQQLFVERI